MNRLPSAAVATTARRPSVQTEIAPTSPVSSSRAPCAS